jgi:hypothetical protein
LCGGFRRLGGGVSSELRRVCRVGGRVGSPGDGSVVLRRPALGLYVGGVPQARPRGRPWGRVAGGGTGGCAASLSPSSSLSATLICAVMCSESPNLSRRSLFCFRPRLDFLETCLGGLPIGLGS